MKNITDEMKTMAAEHDRFMQLALQLAKRGEGFVEPNPMVGCVIVRNNEIIAQGYHTAFGKPHAEAEALNCRTGEMHTAVLYVTLEPCSHFGKQPPCVHAVLESGIRKVVVAMRDPNPKVNGKGIQILRDSGIEVVEGVLRREAEKLNAPFITLMTQQRPWVIAKWAMTLDGKLAAHTGHSHWISSEQSREIVQHLRSRMDAIIVGSGTFRKDQPRLTVRLSDAERKYPRNPQRIAVKRDREILDLQERKTETSRWLFFNGSDLSAMMRQLGGRQFTNVLVEGGGTLLGSFFDAGLIDEVHCFIAPKIIGGNAAGQMIGGHGLDKIPSAETLDDIAVETLGSDVYVRGRVKKE